MKRAVLALAIGMGACAVDDAPLARSSAALWTQGEGDMHSPRALHRAAALPKGRALIVGGASAIHFPGFIALSTAELYEGGAFTETQPMHVGRVLHTATLLADGRVFVAGGASALDSGASTVEIWDPTSGNWTYLPSSSSTHAAHTANLLADGRVMVLGGYQVSTVEIFAPETGTWSAAAPLSNELGAHTTTALADGRFLVVGGGKSWTDSRKETFLYDPSGGVTPLPDLDVPRAGHTATLLADGRVLVAGGAKDGVISGERQSTAEIFDPSTLTWKTVAPSAHRRVFHVAERLPSGNVLVAGGDPDGILSGTDESSAEIYDVAHDKWVPAGAMSTGRTAAVSFSAGEGKVVVAGGFDGEAEPTADVFTIVGLGGGCTSNSACESGFCADGVCCESACRGSCEACDASGSCKRVLGAPHSGHATCDGYLCVSTGCLSSCTTSADCVTGYVCKRGTCERDVASVCSSDRRSSVTANGVSISCGAYLCESGACQTACTSTGQCAPGYACDLEAHRCVSAATGTTAGGCSFGRSEPSFAIALLFAALLLCTRRRGLAASLVASVLLPAEAKAEPPGLGPQGSPITTSGYKIDLFQGPITMSNRATGMGGAYTAIAEGVQGYAVNAAAPAVREAYSRTWFDYDVDLGISFVNTPGPTDWDNDGKTGFDYGGFVFFDVGFNAQFGAWGMGFSVHGQRYDLRAQDIAFDNGLTLYFLRTDALLARSFFDGQLMIGAGTRIVTLQMDAPQSNVTSQARTLFGATSAGPQVGALFAPRALPMRFALTFRGKMQPDAAEKADDVVRDADGSTYLQGAQRWYLPESIEYPWEVEAGFALQLGPRPLNTRFVNTHAPPPDDPDAAKAASKADRIARIEEREKRRYKAMAREKYLFLASLLVSGPVDQAVGVESFLRRVVQRSGKHASITPRVGMELEPFPNVVQLRAGSYLEPSRFDEGHYRPHATIGFDARVLQWSVFGLFDEDQSWRVGGSLDAARNYLSVGVSLGIWH